LEYGREEKQRWNQERGRDQMKATLKRPHIVQTALNDREKAALDLQADREGLSVTAFIRQLVIKGVLILPVESKTLVKSNHEES